MANIVTTSNKTQLSVKERVVHSIPSVGRWALQFLISLAIISALSFFAGVPTRYSDLPRVMLWVIFVTLATKGLARQALYTVQNVSPKLAIPAYTVAACAAVVVNIIVAALIYRLLPSQMPGWLSLLITITWMTMALGREFVKQCLRRKRAALSLPKAEQPNT